MPRKVVRRRRAVPILGLENMLVPMPRNVYSLKPKAGLGRKKRRQRGNGGGVGGFLGDVLGGLGGGVGGGVRNLFSKLFGGRRKPRKQKGRGVNEVLGKLNKIAKDTQIVSKALDEFGAPGIAKTVAGALGYGRRRRTMRGGMSMYRTQQVPIYGMGNLHL